MRMWTQRGDDGTRHWLAAIVEDKAEEISLRQRRNPGDRLRRGAICARAGGLTATMHTRATEGHSVKRRVIFV
jgi:hypothetical protein